MDCLGDAVVADCAVAVAAAVVEPSASEQVVHALAGLGTPVGSAVIFASNCVAAAAGGDAGFAGLGALASCAAGCFVEHGHSPASVLSAGE